MNKPLIALIAGTFAATVGAQGTAPAPTTTQKVEKAMEGPAAKEKQKTVEAATKGTTETAERQKQEAAGVAAAKANKGTAKALPTTADKKKAVDTATKLGTDSGGTMAREQAGVAAAKASKDAPKALPTTKDKAKAVDEATKKGATQ